MRRLSRIESNSFSAIVLTFLWASNIRLKSFLFFGSVDEIFFRIVIKGFWSLQMSQFLAKDIQRNSNLNWNATRWISTNFFIVLLNQSFQIVVFLALPRTWIEDTSFFQSGEIRTYHLQLCFWKATQMISKVGFSWSRRP